MTRIDRLEKEFRDQVSKATSEFFDWIVENAPDEELNALLRWYYHYAVERGNEELAQLYLDWLDERQAPLEVQPDDSELLDALEKRVPKDLIDRGNRRFG